MTTTTTNVREIPPIGHKEAMALAAAEYDRFTHLLRSLDPGDWKTPTVCPPWDVRQLANHVLGAAEANASMRENAHQMRVGKRLARERGYDHWVHGANDLQVAERDHLAAGAVLTRWEGAVPRAVRGRRRFPPFLRPIRIDFGPV